MDMLSYVSSIFHENLYTLKILRKQNTVIEEEEEEEEISNINLIQFNMIIIRKLINEYRCLRLPFFE